MSRNGKQSLTIGRHRNCVIAAAILALSGWGPQAFSATPGLDEDAAIDQQNLCEVDSWWFDDVAGACKPGQKVAFLPKNFGNEQLPVIFAAVNCDLRYSVVLTKGAVTCIYGPITPVVTEPAKQ